MHAFIKGMSKIKIEDFQELKREDEKLNEIPKT